MLQLLPALGDGGVERGTVEMAAFLEREGIDNYVASAGGPLAERVAGTYSHRVDLAVGAKSPVAILANAVRVARLIDRQAIDIVHARSRAPAWAGWLAARYLSRRRPAFVATVHGLYGSGSAIKRWYNSVMLKGSVVIANSDGVARDLVSTYGIASERIVVARRGVDTSEFDPRLFGPGDIEAVRQEFGVPPGAALLLMVGRLTRWKGQHVLVRALAALADHNWVLLLVGSGDGGGSYGDELRQLAASLGVADRIRFTGSRRDIARLNFAADLAFSCSVRPEAFGRVAIEGGAMRTPVIASGHGGSLDTIVDGKTGWLVPPDDAEALAEAIAPALADGALRERIGRAASERVLAEFTAERTCEAEFSAYRRLLTRS